MGPVAIIAVWLTVIFPIFWPPSNFVHLLWTNYHMLLLLHIFG